MQGGKQWGHRLDGNICPTQGATQTSNLSTRTPDFRAEDPRKSDRPHMEWSVNTVYLQCKSQVAPILASIWLPFYVSLILSLIIISNWYWLQLKTCMFLSFLHVVFTFALGVFKMVPHIMGVKSDWLIHPDHVLCISVIPFPSWFTSSLKSCHCIEDLRRWQCHIENLRICMDWVELMIWSPKSQLHYHVLMKNRGTMMSYRSQYEVTGILLS